MGSLVEIMFENKEPRVLLVRRYIVARIYVTLSILITIMASLFDTGSKHYIAMQLTHAPIWALYIALMFCIIGLLDITINDIAPDKFVIKYIYDKRHFIYMGLSLISFSISIVILQTSGLATILCKLWLDGSVAALIAVLDIFARHRGIQWRNTTP